MFPSTGASVAFAAASGRDPKPTSSSSSSSSFFFSPKAPKELFPETSRRSSRRFVSAVRLDCVSDASASETAGRWSRATGARRGLLPRGRSRARGPWSRARVPRPHAWTRAMGHRRATTMMPPGAPRARALRVSAAGGGRRAFRRVRRRSVRASRGASRRPRSAVANRSARARVRDNRDSCLPSGQNASVSFFSRNRRAARGSVPRPFTGRGKDGPNQESRRSRARASWSSPARGGETCRTCECHARASRSPNREPRFGHVALPAAIVARRAQLRRVENNHPPDLSSLTSSPFDPPARSTRGRSTRSRRPCDCSRRWRASSVGGGGGPAEAAANEILNPQTRRRRQGEGREARAPEDPRGLREFTAARSTCI